MLVNHSKWEQPKGDTQYDKKEQGKDVNQTVKMGTTQRGYTM